MIWYMMALMFATLFTAVAIWLSYKFRKEKMDDFIDWTQGKIKKIIFLWIIVNACVTLALLKPLVNTVRCQFDGNVHNTDTTYSWYKDGDYREKCLYTSRTGAKLPLLINRDQPEGDVNVDPQ